MFNYNLELKDLESFITLYSYRSFTKAAENLYITQSALSRRIKALETELGVALVKRGGTFFEVTDAGHQFYKSCIKMMQEKDNIYASMNRFRTGDEGGLRLASDPNYFSLKMIIGGITKLSKEHPRIQISYESRPNLDVHRSLIDDDLDVAFTYLSVAEDYPELSYTVIGENSMVIGVGRNHRLFVRKQLKWSDISGEKLAEALQTSNMAFNKLMQHARDQDCKFSEIHLVKSTEEALSCVATGEYLTIHGALGSEVFESMSDDLHFIPIQDDGNRLGWPVAAYRTDNENPLIQKLLAVFPSLS